MLIEAVGHWYMKAVNNTLSFITFSRRDVVVLLRVSERKVWSSKLYRNTAGIRQEGHPEVEVLRCSSTKSGSESSVVVDIH